MSIAKCVVRLKDSLNTEHSVVVYAESLCEAVLRGLNRLADVGWESETGETIKKVEVEIHQEPTRHIVNVPKLLEWVNRDTMRRESKPRKEVEEVTHIEPTKVSGRLEGGVARSHSLGYQLCPPTK